MRLSPNKVAFFILLLAASPHWGQTPSWQAGIAQVLAKDKSPGTGFVVSIRAERAYVVTSAHVVEGDPNPAVVFATDSDKRRHAASIRDVEGGDPRGLALLVVENPPGGLSVIGPAPDYPAAGSSVVVAGFPAGIGAFTVQPGTIASIRGRDLFLSPETVEGFSGSPVLVDGHAVGLVYGRESGFGKAVVGTASVQPYLKGLGIEWRFAEPQLSAVQEPKPGILRTNPTDGQAYVWIPPGEVQMGCSPDDNLCSEDEKPPRKVRITRGFWLGQTEVTQAAYEKIIGENPSYFRGAQYPVEKVAWDEARKYCEAVSGRLPTEAEWEYAARAGSTGARYGTLDAIAWHVSNSNHRTHPVKQKQPNAWGLYDILGNVWEWVSDWYGEKYYQILASPVVDPKGPPSGTARGVRGASWGDVPWIAHASNRGGYGPEIRYNNIGFRCVREAIP